MVWILLFVLLPDTSHAQTSSDDIRMIRTQVAGRVEVYVEGKWRAVCHYNWDENDARVACRQLGFSDKDAEACGSSCFGRSSLSAGFHSFRCYGNESRLTDCPSNPNNGCREDAGVTCRDVISTTISPLSPQTSQQELCTPVVTTITQQVISTVTQQVTATRQGQCTPVVTTITQQITPTNLGECTSIITEITQQSFTSGAQEACKEETANCTALAGGLGGLVALLALLLVLVVLGWVCSCYRRKVTLRDNSGTDHGRFFNNPNYVPSEPHQYSLDGPREMPLSSGAQPPDAIYDAVTETSDDMQEVGGARLYSTYDVITTDIDHRDEDNTEEAAPYLVVAKSQKEGDHTEEEAAPYLVVAKSQKKKGDHTEEEEAALYSVVTKPQDISIIPEEYSKLHH